MGNVQTRDSRSLESWKLRLILFGDPIGIRQLLRVIPSEKVVAICGASRRPQYLQEIQQLAHGIGAIFLTQPSVGTKQEQEFIRYIQSLKPDLILSNSYSMLISERVIRASRLGGLNIHSSLLPKNRGPNPIQWAIIHGERETGVTLHRLSPKFDQGDIIDQVKVEIRPNDSWLSLSQRLSTETDTLLSRNASTILSGDITGVPQNHELATSNPRRTPDDSEFKLHGPILDSFRLHLASLPPLTPARTKLSSGDFADFPKQMGLVSFGLAIWLLRIRDRLR